MARRHLVVASAVVALGVAFAPGAAEAQTGTPDRAALQPVGSVLRSITPVADATSAGLASHTFTSPASATKHPRVPAHKAAATASGAAAAAAGSGTTGTTLYVQAADTACDSANDPGTGTEASPYCVLQDAINAASPGDTISILPESNILDTSAVVDVSNLTIVGDGTNSPISAGNGGAGQFAGDPTIVVSHASNVTLSDLDLTSYDSTDVEVVDSTGVTLDSSQLWAQDGSSAPLLSIDGTSSDVTVSRSSLTGSGSGISIAAGASGIDVASDLFVPTTATSLVAAGVNGLDVVGNTIQRSCAGAVSVTGSSTAVSIEDNVFEDASTDTGDTKATACEGSNSEWSPDVSVEAGSAPGTTTDYNDFSFGSGDDTAPYGWDGTTYPDLAAFSAATQQGTHDANDPEQFVDGPTDSASTIDAYPVLGSTAIDSANTSAPGRLSSDYFGVSPYTTRGAVQFDGSDPELAVGLSATDTSAYGLSLTSTVTTNALGASYSIDWGDGTAPTTGSCEASCTFVDPHEYAHTGDYQITETLTDSKFDEAVNSIGVTTAGSDFTSYGPARFLDTRSGLGTTSAGPIPSGKSVRIKIGGAGGIPAGITAVAVNITVTGATSNGFATAYPDGGALPATSNVNYVAGKTVANAAFVPVGADGYIDVYNSGEGTSTAQILVDVSGYFTPAAVDGYTAVTPYRLVDTRNGIGVAKAPVASGGAISVPVAAALPAGADPTAVAVNITATQGTATGVLTAYPAGETEPSTSNVNYGADQNVANAAVIPVGTDGKIDIGNSMVGNGNSADVLVDVVGYYSAAGKSAYLPVTPYRYLNTRSSTWTSGPLLAGPLNYFGLPMGLNDQNQDVPDVTGYVVNATVTQTTATGDLAIAPDPNTYQEYQNGTAVPPTPPKSSTLNWTAGETIPNLAQVSTGSTGIVDFWNLGSSGSTALIIDIFGYYQND